LLSDSFPRLL